MSTSEGETLWQAAARYAVVDGRICRRGRRGAWEPLCNFSALIEAEDRQEGRVVGLWSQRAVTQRDVGIIDGNDPLYQELLLKHPDFVPSPWSPEDGSDYSAEEECHIEKS